MSVEQLNCDVYVKAKDDEIARLRAELAAEREAHEETIIHLDAMTAGLNTARADLAAEREKTRQARELASSRGLEAAGLSDERHALRELLRKARPYVEDAARNGDDTAADYATDLCASIDALLNEGRG